MKEYIITNYVAYKRVSLILKELKKLDKRKINILDVGCGSRYITDIIKHKGYNIIGIDKFTSKDRKWINKDPDYVMDATNMSFKDGTFDVVIALEIIEHCPCVNEIKRVLRTNGLLFCSVPSPWTDWLRKIFIFLRLLENQDFEGHHHMINLKKIPMKRIKFKKMFFATSQFGIFIKE